MKNRVTAIVLFFLGNLIGLLLNASPAFAQQATISFTEIIPAGDDALSGGDADMFVRVKVNDPTDLGGTREVLRVGLDYCRCFPGLACGCGFDGAWRQTDGARTYTIDLSNVPEPRRITIELWDDDSTSDDDHIDMTPGDGLSGRMKDVHLSVDTATGTWSPVFADNTFGYHNLTSGLPQPASVGCSAGGDNTDGGLCWDLRVSGTDLMRFYFAPVCFTGTDAQFIAQVDRSLAEFERLLDLPCSDRIRKTVVLPSQLTGPACPACPTFGEFDRDAFAMFTSAASFTDSNLRYIPEKYTAGALLTNNDFLCGPVAGAAIGAKLVWGKEGLEVLPHEFGHLVGLAEEYCFRRDPDKPTDDPAHPNPDLGGSGNCNNVSVLNPLDPALGCDPSSPTCCTGALSGNAGPQVCAPSGVGPAAMNSGACCYGNLGRIAANPDQSKRCVMTSKTGRPHEFCQHCFDHWKGRGRAPQVFPDMGFPVVDCSTNPGLDNMDILAFEFFVGADGKLSILPLSMWEGPGVLGFNSLGTGNEEFRFEVEDLTTGRVVFASSHDLWDAFPDRPLPVPTIAQFRVEARLRQTELFTRKAMRAFRDGVLTWKVTTNGQAPIGNAGIDEVLECAAFGGLATTELVPVGFDADGDSIEFRWLSADAEVVQAGTDGIVLATMGPPAAILLETTDGLYSSFDEMLVRVVDTTPPTITGTPSSARFRTCGASTPTTFAVPAAFDVCSDVTVTGEANGVPINTSGAATLPVGANTVVWTATDEAGNLATFTDVITVTGAVAALRSITIKDGAQLSGVALTNYGMGPITVFPGATTGDLFTDGPVDLKPGSQPGAVHTSADLPPAPVLITVMPPVTLGNVMLEPGQVRRLTPNVLAWDLVSVKSGARLELSPGVYYFNRLQLEPNANVVQVGAGALRIVIGTEFLFRGFPIANAAATRPVVEYLGTQPVFLERAFRGHLLAPRALVMVRGTFTGTLLAGDLEVDAAKILSCAL